MHAGKKHIHGPVAEKLAEHLGSEKLSERELQVLKEIAAGKRNKEIGAELSIAEDTVKMHLKNILEKRQVNDRTEAVTVALRRGGKFKFGRFDFEWRDTHKIIVYGAKLILQTPLCVQVPIWNVGQYQRLLKKLSLTSDNVPSQISAERERVHPTTCQSKDACLGFLQDTGEVLQF